MKYLILPFILFLVGCTSSVDSSLMQELRDVKYELKSCKNSLEAQSTPETYTPPEPEKPKEPEYETVRVFNITTKLGSTSCYTRNNDDTGDDISCGMTFSDCKDGYIYRCMTDVKYKITEERKRVEE